MTPGVTQRECPPRGWPRPTEPPELAPPPGRSGAFGRLATQSSRSRRDAARSGGFAPPGRTLPPFVTPPTRPAETNPGPSPRRCESGAALGLDEDDDERPQGERHRHK